MQSSSQIETLESAAAMQDEDLAGRSALSSQFVFYFLKIFFSTFFFLSHDNLIFYGLVQTILILSWVLLTSLDWPTTACPS